MTPEIFPLAILCMCVASLGNIFCGRALEARPSRPASNRALLFFTGLGLLLGFGFIVMPFGAMFESFYNALGLPALTIFGLDDVSVKAFIVLGLLALVLCGERRPLSSIRIERPYLSDVALGVGAFAIGEAAMYLMGSLLPHRFSSLAEGRHALFLRLPLWLLLLESLVNGIFEEISARGFAVERLSEVTHSTIAGAAIALVLNLLTHIPYWRWRQRSSSLPGWRLFLRCIFGVAALFHARSGIFSPMRFPA